MAPGINGRQTGTVPKIKTHNDSSRDYAQSRRREHSFNTVPNNLVTLEWQPASDMRQSRTRKTSNTPSTSLDYCDLVPDMSVPQENIRYASSSDQQDDQVSWGAVNRYSQEMNGHSEGSVSTSGSSKRSRTPRNVLPDRENKSSNINRMPDRNQVVSHLNQIQDYIKQTSTLMDTLKNSGEPHHQQQYVKLSKMIAELKESERRLQGFLPELSNISQPENDQKGQASKSDKCTTENSSQASSSALDHPGITVNSNTMPLLTGGVSGSTDSVSSSRFTSDESGGTVLKSSDPRRNELKMKVEESQRRLQALQDHQTALMTLQQKAQDQLKEARVAQGILMARAVGGAQSTAPSTPPLVFPATDEHTTVYVIENSNSQTSSSGNEQNINNAHLLQGNMQHLANRLRTLQELYENRNELVQMLGERDEELVSEHMVLQDKLQELQYKKQHMDHLVAEFQALNSLPGVATGSQVDGESSKNESEDGETELLESLPDFQVVRDKITELNMMKAQLAQLKGIMSDVQNRGESIVGISQNGNDETVGAREDEVDHEDQAVNLRRQKRDKSKGMGDRSIARSNSNTSATSSNKPDNIVQASSEVERARDIQHKTIQLQEAKARLQHLQDLLAAVSDFHSHGQPVPDQYLQLLNQEASKEEGAGDQGRDERQTPVVSRPNTQTIQRERTPVRQQVPESVNGLPDNPELSLEAVQAMTRDLRQQTLTLQEERERLIIARKELGKLQRQLPLREKKTNTQVDAQTHQQMLLQAELQAKRHELEELMRKDQGQTSAINQDICSEASADKSETPGYSYHAEGTTNATWGGSTQGTLDDLAEQDNDIQEQSVGYSSDEGQDDDDDDEEEEVNRFPAGSSQQLRLSQLNNNSINNNKDPLSQSHATSRDLLSMSLDSARISLTGNINTNHSNSTSIAGSLSHATPAAGGSNRGQRQCQSSHNIWRKGSADSGTSAPRAVWTPTSQQARQENLCAAEELVSSSNNLDTNNSSSSTATLHNATSTTANPNTNWCQQQVLQLQHQLELTSNLYQSMLHDQAHLQQQLHQQHGNNLLPAAVGSGNNMFSYWSFPPPPYLTPPPPPPLASGGIGPLLPTNDVYYQHLLAASQLQQQQVLLTTVNQCCHLLWLQQREMIALRGAIHTLQEKATCGNGRSRGENYSPPIVIGQPDETVLITSNQNSAQPTPHQSQSNLTRLQQTTTTTNPSMTTTFSPHQNLKLSYSGGLFQSPEDLTASSGVTSAHSLPNLSQATTSASSVFSPHHTDSFPSNAPLNNVTPTFSATPTQSSTQNFPTGTLTLTFPMNNGASFNNRTQQQPLSSLIPQPGSCAPWLQQGAPGGTPGLLQGHTAPSPVPALNNQVPPGNRANNYWDNFRSYSRQNLLSTSTKSNEGASHIPSPLVDRSHNSLRGSVSQLSSFVTSGLQPSTSVLSQSIGSIYSGPEQNVPICNMPRKEKLNTEQYQNSQDNLSLPGPSHNNMSDTNGLHYQLIGTLASSGSSLRSRNQHNSCDFQLQPGTPRPRDSISQDVQFQTTISEGCDSSTNVQMLSGGQHSFSPVPEFHLGSGITMEARNISLQDQQNIILASDVFTLSQNKQGGRGEEEADSVRTSKSQGKAAGVTKKKNPKAGSRHNCRSGHDVPTGVTDPKHQVSNALFEALSESVYTEVAAVISANENRPHFLIQLFRDLQMISSDPLRQRLLQSIQEVVSRHLASETADSRKNAENHQSQIDGQQPTQNEISNDHILNCGMMSSDDETAKNEGSHQLAESLRTSLVEQPGDIHCSTGKCSSRSQSIAESEEGAVALLPSSHSSPRTLPRNAVWNMKDGLSLPSELPGRASKLDWEVQAVLVDLLPFLKVHLDETCSTSLLEAVRRLTLQLVPAQNMSVIASPPQHSPQHTRLGCCYEVQLDALLEDALLKFQGCRLGDISEELLTVVAEVLLSELTFLRLVDTVSRGDNNNEDNEECCKKPAVRDHDLEEHSKNNASCHQPSESTQNFMTSEQANHNYHEPQEVTLGAEAYNGDLAEADQSLHEESVGGLLPDMEVESAGAMSLGDKDLIEMQNNQSEGISLTCLDSAIDVTENGLIQTEGIASDRSGDFNIIELNLEEEWEVEQDREQGLDRVPTRLSTEQQRPSGCSGSSTPERDTHDFVPHPGNQTDVPGP